MNSTSQLDAHFASKINAECQSDDYESDHSRADELLCELLTKLGATKTVEAWEKVGKWYA